MIWLKLCQDVYVFFDGIVCTYSKNVRQFNFSILYVCYHNWLFYLIQCGSWYRVYLAILLCYLDTYLQLVQSFTYKNVQNLMGWVSIQWGIYMRKLKKKLYSLRNIKFSIRDYFLSFPEFKKKIDLHLCKIHRNILL